ncbi:MAG TPA: hypothetical protein VIH08_13240 [Blastococcus sp.]
MDGPPPGAAEAARAALGIAAWPLLRAQVDRLDAATGAALGEDDETARAGGRSGSGPLGGPGRRPGCGHDDGGRRGPLPVDPAGAAGRPGPPIVEEAP